MFCVSYFFALSYFCLIRYYHILERLEYIEIHLKSLKVAVDMNHAFLYSVFLILLCSELNLGWQASLYTLQRGGRFHFIPFCSSMNVRLPYSLLDQFGVAMHNTTQL